MEIHMECRLKKFQNVDQQTGGNWLIQGTKRHKDNQLQNVTSRNPKKWTSVSPIQNMC